MNWRFMQRSGLVAVVLLTLVVIDDIAWFGMAHDQSSPVSTNTSEELNRPDNPIRGYYTAVGNGAVNHYEEEFVSGGFCLGLDGDGSTCHQFAKTADSTDANDLGPQDANQGFVRKGDTVVVFLVWDDVFGATSTDYDLAAVQRSSGEWVASSIDDNTATKEPTEALVFPNKTGADQWYDIHIVNFRNASPAHRFDMFVFGGAKLSNGTRLNFNTAGSSVPAQSDAGGGVISAGAVHAFDIDNDDIEPFSSPFFGTSAAAPHVAGLAALLLEVRPDLKAGGAKDNPAAERAALRNAILDTAVDLGR